MNDQDEVRSSYVAVANALAMRTTIAEDALAQVRAGANTPLNLASCELATLQLRLLCEIYLLGSQLAHLEDAGANLSDKKWRPVDAFAQLEGLSEHPLPVPVEVKLNANGPGKHEIDPKSQPIPFPDLSEIYGRCGDLLHVPTIKQVQKGRLPEFDVEMLSKWVGAFKELTMAHALMLPERKKVLICLWSGEAAVEPTVFRLDATGESTLNINDYPACTLFR
jgi:hypothetical protein